MSPKSHFQVQSNGGRTQVFDLSTGEEITDLVRSISFAHQAGSGPTLCLTLVDFKPGIVVTAETLEPPSPRKKLISAIKTADRYRSALNAVRRAIGLANV